MSSSPDSGSKSTPVLRQLIRTIPSGDRAFARLVERVAERLRPSSPGALEERLRRLFPLVTVRLRVLSNEPLPIWYVYREGRWVAAGSGAWWRSPGLPRLEFGFDGWITAANEAADAFFRVQPGGMVGRHYGEFTVPGTLEDAELLREVLLEVGEVSATVSAFTADRQPVAIELHTRVTDTGLVAELRPSTAAPRDAPRLTER